MSCTSWLRPLQVSTRRSTALASASAFALAITAHGAAAQDAPITTAKPTGKVQEITVTAERRSQNIQKIPASVAVLRGADLLAQGRTTTAQILETVPNVVVNTTAGASGSSGDNPNGNITIRGVQTTQTTGGTMAPSAVATYVDDVFQGIGSNYDLDRVEVLLGPQGTLYGRSATGGVVAFHTVDPVLGKYTGNVSGEYGTADLRQAIVGVNIPIGDTLAVRFSGREYDRDGYYNGEFGGQEITEGRVKVLWQPTADLHVIAGYSMTEQHTNTGGIPITLSAPNTIDYNGTADALGNQEFRYHQYWLEANYNFGFGTLTYVGAIHDYVANNIGTPETARGQTLSNATFNPLDQTHIEELRLSSNPGSTLTWLVGASYFQQLFKTGQTSIQDAGPNLNGTPDTTPGVAGAPIFSQLTSGNTIDTGLFTEETYPVLPNLRVTGGIRYDNTYVRKDENYLFNTNLDAAGNSLLPANNAFYNIVAGPTFNNVTFKARAEYDLTTTDMVYASVSTGFLPGDVQLSPQLQVAFMPIFHVTGVDFNTLNYQPEKLTAYEIGTKNRFLDDTLQLNAAAFYYLYAHYQEAGNIAVAGPPIFSVIAVPVREVGVEAQAIWRFTPNDRFVFNGGLLDAEITGTRDLGGTLGISSNYLALSRLPGIPAAQFNAQYDHTFEFGNGSTLVPRAELRFTGPQDLVELNAKQVEAPSNGGLGERPYGHQGSTAVADLGLTWTSPSGKYSGTGYVRNVNGEVYKTNITSTVQSLNGIDVIPGDPRTFGVVLGARF